MLLILKMDGTVENYENPKFRFHIKAPMYWWLDCEFEKYNFCMPMDSFEYCWDAWGEEAPIIKNTMEILTNISRHSNLQPRKLMQLLPLSTYLEGDIELTYKEIIGVCENYCFGEYDYKELYNEWPISREWTDFCETLLDIAGVRTYLRAGGISDV